MNINLIFIIIATIIFISGIIFFVLRNKNTIPNSSLILSGCFSDKDCDIGNKCVFNPDYGEKKCIPVNKDYCDIKDEKDLILCSSDLDCAKCINGHETGTEGLVLSCVNVIDTSSTGTVGPNSVDKNLYSSLLPNLKPGNYCLPKMAQGEKCNIFTSDTILTRTNDGSYKWGCKCKNENRLFQSTTNGGDCTNQIACNNGKYPLYALKHDKNGNLLTCKQDSDCGEKDVCWDNFGNKYGDNPGYTGYCYTKWTPDINSNPFDGYCKCDSGKYSYKTVDAAGNIILECVEDTCAPIGNTVITNISDDLITFTADTCNCPSGYIKCPQDFIDSDDPNVTAIHTLCKDKPRCLPDPCKNKICSNDNYKTCKTDSDCGTGNTCIDDNSKYNTITGNCDCSPGYYSTPNEYSYVGHSCINPCAENPCSNRGTCYVDTNDNNKPKCKDCKSPFIQDPDNLCKHVENLTCCGSTTDLSGKYLLNDCCVYDYHCPQGQTCQVITQWGDTPIHGCK